MRHFRAMSDDKEGEPKRGTSSGGGGALGARKAHRRRSEKLSDNARTSHRSGLATCLIRLQIPTLVSTCIASRTGSQGPFRHLRPSPCLLNFVRGQLSTHLLRLFSWLLTFRLNGAAGVRIEQRALRAATSRLYTGCRCPEASVPKLDVPGNAACLMTPLSDKISKGPRPLSVSCMQPSIHSSGFNCHLARKIIR